MSKVYVFLAEGFEEIEGLTVVDLLRRANLETEMVSVMEGRQIKGSHGIKVTADSMFSDVDFSDADLLVLPGGMPGTLNLGANKYVLQTIVDFHVKGKLVSAICAAPSVFGQLGFLNGKAATCYPGFEDKLEGASVCAEKVVVDGNVTTAKGMGAAIDFSLKLIEQLLDKETADKISEGIIYR